MSSLTLLSPKAPTASFYWSLCAGCQGWPYSPRTCPDPRTISSAILRPSFQASCHAHSVFFIQPIEHECFLTAFHKCFLSALFSCNFLPYRNLISCVYSFFWYAFQGNKGGTRLSSPCCVCRCGLSEIKKPLYYLRGPVPVLFPVPSGMTDTLPSKFHVITFGTVFF